MPNQLNHAKESVYIIGIFKDNYRCFNKKEYFLFSKILSDVLVE